ncbi:MAG TPA: DUF5666 domain-containing protein [Steroidobacteraceae bacterium]|jgi:hypothetical protein|nr:DUF5666 domain-containing protein [Steroidobacteraceae bacterium]
MNTLKSLPALLALLALAACGGGGGGNGGPIINPPPSDGIVRTGMAVGPIASFGSVVVNGIHYETDDAVITIDGEPATQDDLRVGQVVRIVAELEDGETTGTASSVDFDDNVEGPIASIDLAAGSFVVLGQTVLVGASTSFDDDISPRSLEGLAPGDFVEVSGLVRADGSIDATRIERNAGGGELEVHGVVSSLDTANQRFNLNDLVVDYSAAQLDDFPAGGIADGQPVEAKGTALDGNGALVATEVEFEGSTLVTGDEDDFGEFEGFITRFVSATDFDVAGVPVTTNASTVFEDGTAADLALNVKVEVEGVFDAEGRLVADEVDIKLGGDIEIAGFIDAVDAASDSITVLGITIETDALTRFEDKTDARVSPLTIADLAVGDYVELRGAEAPANSGTVRAALLERDDADDESELRGFVTAVAAPTITILGVTIQTDGATEFEDENDQPISQAEFFSRAAAGSLVKVSGAETSDTTILAEEVELED